MSRNPYTYSADFVRSLGPVNKSGVVLSRADASQIVQGIAEVLGMTHEALSSMLSLAEQNKSDEDIQNQAERIMRAYLEG